MREQRIVYVKNRGALIDDWELLLDKVPGAKSLPITAVHDLHVYSFDCVYNGLPAVDWAKFWIQKGDKRAKKIGTWVPIPTTKREGVFTSGKIRQEYRRSRTPNNLKKKVRKSAGAWSSAML